MRRLVVEISDTAFSRLVRRALSERRPTRDQAAVLLEQAVSEPDAGTPPPGCVPASASDDDGSGVPR